MSYDKQLISSWLSLRCLIRNIGNFSCRDFLLDTLLFFYHFLRHVWSVFEHSSCHYGGMTSTARNKESFISEFSLNFHAREQIFLFGKSTHFSLDNFVIIVMFHKANKLHNNLFLGELLKWFSGNDVINSHYWEFVYEDCMVSRFDRIFHISIKIILE